MFTQGVYFPCGSISIHFFFKYLLRERERDQFSKMRHWGKVMYLGLTYKELSLLQNYCENVEECHL